ncbi:uncharacterized protein ASPGLDRAFT_43552 [Aspergillus glaucus CBS 516.65]|uniref:Uncharacterized protein n=1 Tax=Aspergillus glaucus CBS 516.65 TaxID=1160497 RepID=A0A1L9VT57_ASPGL|nr:hypothetical protein ASPGLDRAFT_43552 [Aspergillus glaucus CBS 516.65]OJJ87072.1 hypothetical protein ASPGLDRAFT_43552 [Aspergillus glaucus CBS 516.65]
MDETSAEEHTAQHTKTREGTKETSNPFQLRLFDRLTIDTPSTRQVEGQILAVAKKRVHCEGPAGYQWMEQIWCWFGQEAIDVEECHGVPLRDSEGHVFVSLVVLTVTILGLWMRYRDSWKMVSALVKGSNVQGLLQMPSFTFARNTTGENPDILGDPPSPSSYRSGYQHRET